MCIHNSTEQTMRRMTRNKCLSRLSNTTDSLDIEYTQTPTPQVAQYRSPTATGTGAIAFATSIVAAISLECTGVSSHITCSASSICPMRIACVTVNRSWASIHRPTLGPTTSRTAHTISTESRSRFADRLSMRTSKKVELHRHISLLDQFGSFLSKKDGSRGP